ALLQADIPEAGRFDVVIVDEGQDFSEAWRDGVLRLLKPDGRAIWLEDPTQNLYGREPVALDGWVTLRSGANFRSPRDVVGLLERLHGRADGAPAIEAASPFASADIDILPYRDGDIAAMHDQTKQAVKTCLGAGFARGDIAIL